MAAHLQIYVSAHCPNCQKARNIFEALRVEFPEVICTLVEDQAAGEWPSAIIATPAYVLDGKLISLGNPDADDLRALLAER